MNRLIKILFLVLLVLPIWLTIVAFAEPVTNLDFWKGRINARLLENKIQRIQVTEILAKASDFDESLANSAFELDLSGVRERGISDLALKFSDKSGTLSKLLRVRAKLFIQEEVPVATRGMQAGDIVQTQDFRMEWRDASRFTGRPIRSGDLVGKTVRTTTPENEIIYDTKIARPQLVSRGDRVKISVIGSGLTISAIGIAQEGGSIGQTIKVINGDSRKEILGIVTDARAVEVRL